MGRHTGLSRFAVTFHWLRRSGPLSASLSFESSALDKLEPPKAVTAPQYHLYVHLAPVRMLLTFYKSQKHLKSTGQSQKNLSNWPVCWRWASQQIARHGIHPITIVTHLYKTSHMSQKHKLSFSYVRKEEMCFNLVQKKSSDWSETRLLEMTTSPQTS